MNTAEEIAAFETRVSEARIKIADVLREAGIDRSMWTRWRNGTTVPRLDNWRAVESAAERLGLPRAAA
jgi:hypothetical protein